MRLGQVVVQVTPRACLPIVVLFQCYRGDEYDAFRYCSFVCTDVLTELENLNSRISCIRSVVHGLPQANFDLLKRVAEHLDR